MDTNNKYASCFRRAFHLDDDEVVTGFAYQSNVQWDSVGHLTLVTEIENTFGIQLDVDDVIDFSSFEVGKQILEKYGLRF